MATASLHPAVSARQSHRGSLTSWERMVDSGFSTLDGVAITATICIVAPFPLEHAITVCRLELGRAGQMTNRAA